MSELFYNNEDTIQRLLLWDQLEATLRKHAFELGIQLDENIPHANLFLVSKPCDNFITHIRGKWESGLGITVISLLFKDFETGVESESYTIRQTAVTAYPMPEEVPTAYELRELRADVEESLWDSQASRDTAEESDFWE